MNRARDLLDEFLQECFDHVRRSLWLEADVSSLDERVRYQREREWMTVGEIEDGSMLFGGDLPLGEVGLTLLLIQVMQGQRAYEGLPAWIREPARFGWIALAKTTSTLSGSWGRKTSSIHVFSGASIS